LFGMRRFISKQLFVGEGIRKRANAFYAAGSKWAVAILDITKQPRGLPENIIGVGGA
jgi:hypothetical protein